MPDHPIIPLVPHDHAPHGHAEHGHAAMEPDSLERRAFLKIMAASMALASGACSGPPGEVIVPYVQMPEHLVLGQPLFYATAFVRRGYASGVLVESNMGRPTKVEGNPQHPSSLGATDVFAQASILQLWDPDRSQSVYQGNTLAGWQAFETALQEKRAALDKNRGAGLRILTGTITSPTLAAQLAALLKRYPEARWHAWDPLHDDGALEAVRLAFGQAADTVLDFSRAARVLCLDADVFGDWPGSVRHARDFTRSHKSEVRNFSSRMIALESTPTFTGAYADNQLALTPMEIERFVWRLAARLGIPGVTTGSAPNAELGKWEENLARELNAHRGAGLIVAGAKLSPQTRALVHLMNAHLGNAGTTAMQIAPVEALTVNHADSIAQLAADMRAGRVDSLFILDGNPVYNAPADLDFADALNKVPFSVHLGLYRNETGRRTTWHIPQTHLYEQWSDARAHDGTATILQPVIAPLYGGRSAHEVIALLGTDTERNGQALVRRTWQQHAGGDFNRFWEASLRRGLVENSASAPLKLRPAQAIRPPALQSDGLVPLFAADPSTGDGEFANNAWLQELPRPLTKLTWDNAALVSPATARKLGVDTGDVVRLSLKERPSVAVNAPVWVLPGHADNAVTLPLGYGRTAAGRVGNRVGFDAYRLKTLAAAQGRAVLQVEKTRTRYTFATTQNHARMEGRDLMRMATLEEYRRKPQFATEFKRQRVPEETLYPQVVPYKDYKWGMAIDLNTCIGCNACTIACQAENNIPTVGKEEVIRGREMHWIRVDRYYLGKAERPRTVFQPVPCMHCEKAPCEEVCPVGATVHDSEGLNVQVYNRCVGTRFCSNNCPYKVRRFNFFQYSNTDIDSLKAAQNPEVSVRRRGVMEKCSYCLQRVTRARLEAEKLGRRIQDGEVVTACQAVCPTEAITFGDLNDPDSKVNRVKASPLDYTLLAELNTRPRTTYAARVINPDPELE